ncbi:MAG: LbtU family siderophore porin [bacterium]
MRNNFLASIFILGLCFLFVIALTVPNSIAGYELSGVVETELGYVSTDTINGDSSSTTEISLATVELAIDADINESVKGNVVLLFEENETELDIDTGTITIANEAKCPFSLTIGKMVVPFGNFATHFVSDPFTLEIGETIESALLLGYAKGLASGSLTLFNGDIDETDNDANLDNNDNMIETFVLNVALDIPSETMPINFGISYISNIADTDTIGDLGTTTTVDSAVGGLNVYLTSKSGPITLEAEYVQAMGEFEVGDLGLGGIDEKKPGAWNVEIAYEVSEKLEVAGKYEQTMDLDYTGSESYETRFGIAASYGLYEATTLSVELLNSTGYDPGAGLDEATETAVTAQLAIEF